jgi:hypothetical protein
VVKIRDFKGALSGSAPKKIVNSRGWEITEPNPLKCRNCMYCEAVDEYGVICLKSGSREFRPTSFVTFCTDFAKKRGRLV